MTRRAPRVPEDAPGLAFLTAADLRDLPAPPRPGLRPGEWARVLRPRFVCRTGYRLRSDDPAVREEAAALLRSPAGREVLSGLSLLAGRPAGAEARAAVLARDAAPGPLARELRWLLQRALVRERRFGGSERGVWVADCLPSGDARRLVSAAPRLSAGDLVEVVSTRRCWAGTRYGASGGGGGSGWEPNDHEPGGLSGAVAFPVAALADGFEVLAADLAPACPARCGGTNPGWGGFVHAERCRREFPPRER